MNEGRRGVRSGMYVSVCLVRCGGVHAQISLSVNMLPAETVLVCVWNLKQAAVNFIQEGTWHALGSGSPITASKSQ